MTSVMVYLNILTLISINVLVGVINECLSLKDYIIIAGIWITYQRRKLNIRFAVHVRRSRLIRAGEYCRYCGAIFNLTKHHLRINGHKINYKITLCRNCHDDVDFRSDQHIKAFIRSQYVID